MTETPKPVLDRMSFTFSQESNCVSDSDEMEVLTIEVESSLGIDFDKGGFFVLKTDKWSVDKGDLEDLIERIETSVKAALADNFYKEKEI